MENNPTTDHERELIELLRRLPLEPVPDGLAGRVMARVGGKRRPALAALWDFVSQPRTLSFRPVYALALAVLVLGSFYLGRGWQSGSPLPAVTPASSPAAVAPEVLVHPGTALAIGRALLDADDDPARALAYLQRASLLAPDNPEFAYWEGLAHWANGDREFERRSYERGLAADPESVPLLVNLGHNYLGDQRYREALAAYQAVLRLVPDEPTAVYNSGLIYRKLGLAQEEMAAWRSYLQGNRTGNRAFRAVARLNGAGDFSFRSYPIGFRSLIIDHRSLLDESLSMQRRREELADIAALLEQNRDLGLEVVAFVAGDREAARNRAVGIKEMLIALGGDGLGDRVRLSWFDVPEQVRAGAGGTTVELSEGLLFFSRVQTNHTMEASI